MPSPSPSPAMSPAAMKLEALLNSFSIETADAWLRQIFGSYDTTMRRDVATGNNQNERAYFRSAMLMGYVKELSEAPRSSTNCPLMVVSVHMKDDLAARDSRVAQFGLAKRLIKEAVNTPQVGVHGIPSQGLFFFHDDNGHFRLSLVSGSIVNRRFDFNSAKRQSFFVTSGADNPTIRRRFNTSIRTFADVKNVFSVEALTKDFYKSLFDWYIWATETDKTITFPNDLATHADDRDYLAEAVIRLITRLMFIWFIKQKGLVPDELFESEWVNTQLKEFDASSREQDNYYRVILQNLFFATLNCREDKRKFKGNSHHGRNHEYGIATCYRYSDEMQDKDAFMELMKKIPFLNCTLFDCLDKKEREQDGGREIYLDGFSDRKSHRAHIHNAFFFDEAKGIIPLFRQYEFTVNENSATDTDVALDPELLGKVFENLLGSYNPETKETARKATGAFYTPREIVNYMVRESLKCYLQRVCPFADNARMTELFNEESTEQITSFSDAERRALLDAIYNCKILDPACGSGAFPMGVLHIMVHALSRLDKKNLVLRERLLARYKEDKEILLPGTTKAEQEEYIATLDKQLREGQLYPDYARKLYLIENCIYGIDIQPIATQISKLRFFISLLCDQLRDSWNPEAENHGLLSLPNLEAKFVCADSLRSLPKLAGDNLALGTANIQELKQKLEKCRHLVFSARTYETKNKRKEQELEIRDQIRDSIKHSLSTPDTALIEQCRRTIADLQPQYEAVKERKIELQTVTEQADLFSEPQQVIKEVDINEPRRRKLFVQIRAAKSAIATELAKAQQAGTTELDKLALAVSGWNPYDQNACSNFFDAEWMFNIDNGFDIVIGNPPYFVLKNNNPLKAEYERLHAELKSGRSNIYQFFFSAAHSFCSATGIVTYIHPKTLFCDSYLSATRNFLLRHFGKAHLIDICDRKGTFEAVLQSVVITMWEKSEAEEYYCADVYKKEDLEHLQFLKLNKERLVQDNGALLVRSVEDVYRIVEKTRNTNRDYLNFRTGSIEWNKYKSKLIGEYQTGLSRLIYGTNIQRFFFEETTNRDDKRYFSSGNLPTLSDIVIIAQRTTSVEQRNRIFADVVNPADYPYPLVTENNTSVCSFNSDEDASYALGFLNSTFADFYFRLFNSNTHVSSSELNRIPIPRLDNAEKATIINQVKRIKKLASSNADITHDFSVLDEFVYAAYGLSIEDINFIKRLYNQEVEQPQLTQTATRQIRLREASRPIIQTEDEYLD